MQKKTLLALLLALMMILSGCSLVTVDTEKDNAQVILDVGGETYDKATVTNLVSNQIYQNQYMNQLYASVGMQGSLPTDTASVTEQVINDLTISAVEKQKAKETDDGVQFNAEGFSVWGVVYTVDFEYTDPETGETKKWSLPGQGTYKISDIMAEIGVNGTVEAVDLVLVEAVGKTDDTALYLDTVEGEWVLKSDVAFDDTYRLSVTVDGVEYQIVVTDKHLTSINISLSLGSDLDTTNYDYYVALVYNSNLHRLYQL